MSELRTRMDNDMVLRGMAERTRTASLDAVRALAKFYRRSPDQLSVPEIQRLLEWTLNLKHRVLLMATYSAGLRVSEVVHLRVSDIDSARMAIRVEEGKGAKDRYTLLSHASIPQHLLRELRRYWVAYRPRVWLFPLRTGDHPISARSAEKTYEGTHVHDFT